MQTEKPQPEGKRIMPETCFLLLVFVFPVNQSRTKGEGWSTGKKFKPPPSNVSAGRPKAALLFWFFADFRCGALLFMVILVI